jgi:hypothetical protein
MKIVRGGELPKGNQAILPLEYHQDPEHHLNVLCE